MELKQTHKFSIWFRITNQWSKWGKPFGFFWPFLVFMAAPHTTEVNQWKDQMSLMPNFATYFMIKFSSMPSFVLLICFGGKSPIINSIPYFYQKRKNQSLNVCVTPWINNGFNLTRIHYKQAGIYYTKLSNFEVLKTKVSIMADWY